jgi:type IV pilus assembly protein PilY1
MKRLTALAVISALVLSLPPAARADDTDIFGANIQPNVMILIDSSQSMGDDITSIPYDPATHNAVVNKCGSQKNQACNSSWDSSNVPSGSVYKSGSNNTYTLYQTSISSVNSSSARNALKTTGFWSGSIGGQSYNLYAGNYLNYLLGVCVASICSEPKINIAKRAVTNLISNTEGVRFGTMKFKSNGGQIINPIGTDTTTLVNGVNSMTLTSVGTMTGEQIRDVGLYYNGTLSGFASPIQLKCQPNFAIVVSDGLYTGIDPRPQAKALFTGDFSSFPGTQNVVVHTVGFGVGASEPSNDVVANDVLKQAAQQGGGSYYRADSSTALENALQDAIRKVKSATFTFATPVLPTTSTTGSTKAYLAAFLSDVSRPFWNGYLRAYQRDTNGLVPVDPTTGVPLSTSQVWEAGQQLSTMASGSRTIYTVVGGSQQAFAKSNSAITPSVLGVTTSTERDRTIDFIRGVDVLDEDQDGNVTEDRSWKLGDIFHSTPVLVTPPVLALADASYIAFRQANASRTTVLIAGANDGQLHAFRESDGTELWSFIPPDLLPRLHNLVSTSDDHDYYVDSSPIAADVKVGGAWKTIVFFGLRRGGNFYYAIDITNTTSPQYLWSFTDGKMGETWSEAAIGRVCTAKSGPTCTAEKWVAFVGGGYYTPENNKFGKAFFVIDLSNGSKLWEYSSDNSTSNDITSTDRQYMNFSLAANPTAADVDSDGYVDRVYIGDVGGQLWKFDVSDPNTSYWKGRRLFAASPGQTNPPVAGEYYPAQAIYSAPALAFDKAMALWVFFGTGDRNHPNNAATNRFYGIKDSGSMTNGSYLSESDLVDVTSTNGSDPDGWFVRLGSTEKVLSAANVFDMNVFFSGFTPSTTVTCDGGSGTAKLYAVQMQSGYAAINFSTGLALSTTDSSATRSRTIGTGIASMPVIVVTPPTPGGNPSAAAITATTDQQLPSTPVPAPPFLKQVRSWREEIN